MGKEIDQTVRVPKLVVFETPGKPEYQASEPAKPHVYTAKAMEAFKKQAIEAGFTPGTIVVPRKGLDVELGLHARMMVTWVYDTQPAASEYKPIEAREIRVGTMAARRYWPEELFILWTCPSRTELDERVQRWRDFMTAVEGE